MATNRIHSSISMKSFALKYASSRGIPVFPLHTVTKNGGCSCSNPECRSVGKHPYTKNGVKDATTDEQQIMKWWSKWPNANIGMPMGRETGLFALDVDKGGDEELKKYPQLPHSIQSRTGSGRRHIIFFTPRHMEIKNRTRFLPGLDIRGEGGYIVVPPSIHESGKCYEWKLEASISEYDPTECPNWLLEELIENSKKPKANTTLNNSHTPYNKERIEQQVKHIVKQVVDKRVIIGDDSYGDWLNIGFALVNGLREKGRDYFHKLSSVSHKYDREECDKQYDRCLRSKGNGITIGTLFHYAQKAGIRNPCDSRATSLSGGLRGPPWRVGIEKLIVKSYFLHVIGRKIRITAYISSLPNSIQKISTHLQG